MFRVPAKESAYKLARRRDPRIVFSPRRFVVSLNGASGGSVHHLGIRYPLRLDVDAERVHAVVTAPEAAQEPVLCGAVERPGDPGGAARALAIAAVAARLGIGIDELTVERRARMPWLRLRGAWIRGDLSLSHHGRFAAYACVLR